MIPFRKRRWRWMLVTLVVSLFEILGGWSLDLLTQLAGWGLG